MGFFDKVRAWMGLKPAEPATAVRYDNVRIQSLEDGSVIEGHEAVTAYFEKERALLDEHGSNLIFQVYRVNLQAKSLDEIQGSKLAEIIRPGNFVSGNDTVAAVKERLRALIAKEMPLAEIDQMSLSFGGRRMQEDKLFYADHYMMLPCWVQILVHACDVEEIMQLARKLREAKQ